MFKFDSCNDQLDLCDSCGWTCEFVECHVEHSMLGYGIGKETRCKYMDKKYNMWIDEDGELCWKEKEVEEKVKQTLIS